MYKFDAALTALRGVSAALDDLMFCKCWEGEGSLYEGTGVNRRTLLWKTSIYIVGCS